MDKMPRAVRIPRLLALIGIALIGVIIYVAADTYRYAQRDETASADVAIALPRVAAFHESDAMPAFDQHAGIDHSFVVTTVASNARQPAAILPDQTYMVSSIREGFRQDSQGVAQDDILVNQEWGFDLAGVRPRIDIWHGEADVIEDSYVPEQDKRWVVVAPPGAKESRLLLARAVGEEQSSRIGNQTGGRVFLFLFTDDFWRDYRAYQAKGIEFVREPKVESYGTVAVFADLYGNLWDLLEPAPAAG